MEQTAEANPQFWNGFLAATLAEIILCAETHEQAVDIAQRRLRKFAQTTPDSKLRDDWLLAAGVQAPGPGLAKGGRL